MTLKELEIIDMLNRIYNLLGIMAVMMLLFFGFMLVPTGFWGSFWTDIVELFR